MPGEPRELVEHSLNVRPDAKPVKQPLRRFAEEKRRAIGEEIARLLAAGFIMEVFYPDWLANPVLVLKKNNTWRMCIGYTSLNKACPKDPFALPRIDQVIDSTAGCDLMSFLDAYSGYHQIPLYQPDQIKKSFITPYGQVEKANRLVLAGIRPRLVEPLKRSASCWVEELPSVLWSLRTTPNRSVGFTPFFLVYRAEAVLPTDIEFDAPRVVQYTEKQAKEAREDGIDLLEEAREQALARSALYQ
jgi:hypothetical protein